MRHKSQKGKKPFSLEEQVEWIAIAFVLALTVRCFIVEAYQIPTGSMAPTLYGEHYQVTCGACGGKINLRYVEKVKPNLAIACPLCAADITASGAKVRKRGGDRILVSKNLYFFTKPKRWDIFVFKSPENGKENTNFVKRLVGLPGETVVLKNGQVFVDGQIARKPAGVQKRLWQDVYNGPESKSPGEFWKSGGGWSVTKSGFDLPDESVGLHTVRYVKPILDHYDYNGDKGQNVVGDLQVKGHVLMGREGGEFSACLWDESEMSGDTWKAVFRPGATSLSVEVRKNEAIRETAEVPLAAPREFDFSFSRADGIVEVSIDGGGCARIEEELTAESSPPYTFDCGVFLEGGGSAMVVKDVEIKRDIYYRADLGRGDFSGEPYVAKIAPGHYLGLGDNSPISNDSRFWGTVPEANVLGKAFFVFWPPTRMGLVF